MAFGVPQLVALVHLSHSTCKTDKPVTKLVNRVQTSHKRATSAGFSVGLAVLTLDEARVRHMRLDRL